MGRYLIGEEVCNNCIHWLCHTERKFSGNPPKEVYTESNCDECSVTEKNTLSKNTCAAFKHIGGITKTFPARAQQSSSPFDGMISDLDESTRTLLSATMEYEKNKLAINKACQVLSENDGDGDDNGEALANALAKHGDAVAEQKKANERATELLDEGMDPKCMFQDKSVEFMHMLDNARSGNPEAQYEFAKAFWDGSHGALSAESLSAMNKSRIPHDWCRKAAENGLTEAEYHIGHCGWDGKEKSVEWLRRAADKGHGAAKSELEELVSELAGNSMELLTKCITVLSSKKSDEGISEAISCIREASLILSHSDGWSTTVPLYKLDEWFVNNFIKTIESIADTGLPDLQNVIGKMFGAYSSFESIVKKDWGSAVRWFEHAAESGCLEAMDNLGTCFANGNGVVKNDKVAADWYRKAALGGLDLGQYHYACRLMSGEGVAKDIEGARSWLQKAAAQGLKKARDRLDILDDECDGSNPISTLRAGWRLYNKHDYSAAIQYFRKADEFGFAEAKYALGKCYYFGDGVEKNETTATEFLKEATKTWFADSDQKLAYKNMYSDACDMLGDCFLDGNGTAKDVLKALAYFRKAARCSCADAAKELGYDFLNERHDVRKDIAQAIYWLQHSTWSDHGDDSYTITYLEEAKSAFESDSGNSTWIDMLKESVDDFKLANSGDADAQVRVGDRFFRGDGVDEKDLNAAAYWWHRAAVNGCASAQHKLGMAYYFGKGVEENEPEAFKWFEKAATQGHAKAMCRYAECFRCGNGTDKNFAKAIEWYRKSAEAGEALAQENLAMMYYKGLGAEKDLEEAFKWFKKAADEDRDKAQFWVGKFYAEGLGGVEKDLSKAVEWYEKSAEQDNSDAICALGWCYQLGDGVEQDFAKAVEWFRKGADNNDGVCMNNLARLVEDGKGVDQDYDEALALFKKAAENDCARANYHIGRFYENGLGVDVDIDTAKEWYQKAADEGDKDAKAALESLG